MRMYRLAPLVLLLLTACGGGGGGDPAPGGDPDPAPVRTSVDVTVTVNWSPNPDYEVSQPGGGYRLYYSASPFTSGAENGVSVIDNIPNNVTSQSFPANLSGNWYVRVQAFSQRNPGGSALSAQLTVNVPAS